MLQRGALRSSRFLSNHRLLRRANRVSIKKPESGFVSKPCCYVLYKYTVYSVPCVELLFITQSWKRGYLGHKPRKIDIGTLPMFSFDFVKDVTTFWPW